MSILFRRVFIIMALLVAGCQTVAPTPDTPADIQGDSAALKAPGERGYLVVAPDRGFMGNQEIREIFAPFSHKESAELVFVTDVEKTSARLESGVNALRARGAKDVIVLPLFVSENHPGLKLARAALERNAALKLTYARALGQSYLGVELLADRLREVETPDQKHLVVVGFGASSEADQHAMQKDYLHLAKQAAQGFDFPSIDVVIWPAWSAEDKSLNAKAAAQFAAATSSQQVVVVPFHLGMKLDGMMTFDGMVLARLVHKAGQSGGHHEPQADAQHAHHGAHHAHAKSAPQGKRQVTLIKSGITPDPLVGLWMQREANRFVPLNARNVGVVVLAHGSNFDWNETMRESVRPLEDRYMIEYGFSMADRDVTADAIRRLEGRGARAVVVVRVFGLATSFESTIQNLLGLDIEFPAGNAGERKAAAHGHAHGHGPSTPGKRIRTSAVTTTLGGLEDHAIFAKALTERLAEISTNPAKETVILAAHGMGNDAQNAHWLEILASLSAQIKAQSGVEYRAFHFGTWREDWPDKRQEWVPKMRQWVADAAKDGGRALVIPARTNGQGPADTLLEGLDYTLSSGFAPHALFANWFEDQIQQGIKQLEAQ